jgi:hypothetical protein
MSSNPGFELVFHEGTNLAPPIPLSETVALVGYKQEYSGDTENTEYNNIVHNTLLIGGAGLALFAIAGTVAERRHRSRDESMRSDMYASSITRLTSAKLTSEERAQLAKSKMETTIKIDEMRAQERTGMKRRLLGAVSTNGFKRKGYDLKQIETPNGDTAGCYVPDIESTILKAEQPSLTLAASWERATEIAADIQNKPTAGIAPAIDKRSTTDTIDKYMETYDPYARSRGSATQYWQSFSSQKRYAAKIDTELTPLLNRVCEIIPADVYPKALETVRRDVDLIDGGLGGEVSEANRIYREEERLAGLALSKEYDVVPPTDADGDAVSFAYRATRTIGRLKTVSDTLGSNAVHVAMAINEWKALLDEVNVSKSRFGIGARSGDTVTKTVTRATDKILAKCLEPGPAVTALTDQRNAKATIITNYRGYYDSLERFTHDSLADERAILMLLLRSSNDNPDAPCNYLELKTKVEAYIANFTMSGELIPAKEESK